MREVQVKSQIIMVGFDSPRESMNFWLEKLQNQTPSEVYAYDLIPESKIDGTDKKYKASVIFDAAPRKFQTKDLKFRHLLKKDEKEITGEMALRRSMELQVNFGLCDGKCMLDHQDDLPDNLRSKRITLIGTMLCFPDDSENGNTLVMPQLVFEKGRWQIQDCWIGDPFGENDLFPFL